MSEMKTVKIWGKELQLEIDYDRDYENEILPVQREALADFIKNISIVDESIDKVKAYCIERDGVDIADKSMHNIFEYVTPTSIFIPTLYNKVEAIGLMCEYIFDPEHGIAVVFKDGKFFEVGSQDIIL